MSYYMGDFYRGDFYRGDPGFWSSMMGVGRRILGVGTAAIPGGSIVRAGTTAIERVGRRAGAAIMRHPVLSAAGAAGVIGAAAGGGAEALMAGGGAAKGFHPCKHPGRCKQAIVRNRHMRVTNPRALRRALRRVGGFSRLARRVMHFTHPRSKGRLAFKFPRRRKK